MSGQVILFLPSFEAGGVERNAVYFANAMAAKGFDVHLVYCRKKDEWFSRLDTHVRRVKVARWIRFPLLHERLVDAINMLFFGIIPVLRIRRNGRTAMVSFQSNVIAIFLGLLCRIPVAVRLSNHFEVLKHEKSLIRKLAEFGKKKTYGFADVIIANSSELAKDYSALLRKSVETIHNPVDFEKVQRLKEGVVDEALFVRKRRPIITSAGRLAPQKNYGLLVRAMVEVVKTIPCDLVVLGEGGEREPLEKLVHDLGLDDFIHFLGYRDNVYKYYRCSDLFVLSSHYEGMPNVLVEAVACGLPVVSTRCKSGPAEILCDGQGGELVPVGDHHALAAGILRALTEPALTAQKKQFAFTMLSRFALAKVEQQYANLIGRMLSKE